MITKYLSILLTLIGLFTTGCQDSADDKPSLQQTVFAKEFSPSKLETLSTVKLFAEEGRHSAFTDLIQFNGWFFLTFRNSDSHAFSENGVTILMRSQDLTEWEIIETFSHPDFDLRDPKFAINNGRLELNIHGSHFVDSVLTNMNDFRSYYNSRLDSWSNLIEFSVGDDPNTNEAWPWKITYAGDTAYTFGYIYNLVGKEDLMDLYLSTDDGLSFYRVNQNPTNLANRTGEGIIRVTNTGNYYCIIRQNRGKDALFGKSVNPMDGWSWSFIKKPSLGGPNFIACDDNTFIISGRDNSIRGATSTFVGIYNYQLDSLVFDLQLPSGGDTGYPGLVVTNDTLAVSYYSSHENTTGIYLSLIKLK